MRRTAALLAAAALVVLSAGPASAHASHVTHQETCTDGQTTTVVMFDNDYAAPADVGYQWGSEPAATAHLAAKTGSSNSTVALPSHPVGTLAWHVTWADGYRQPSSGESTLTVEPLTDCHAATTTTTAPATTTTTAAATTTTAAAAVVAPTTTTTLPTAVLGTAETLPRTGVPIAFLVLCAVLALCFGLTFRYLGGSG